jgi:hypothetical protein
MDFFFKTDRKGSIFIVNFLDRSLEKSIGRRVTVGRHGKANGDDRNIGLMRFSLCMDPPWIPLGPLPFPRPSGHTHPPCLFLGCDHTSLSIHLII